ncbi:unnamed protein product [Nippostrongylus brasiliensis]|uniref:Secreted protein n=1 Tax=Nippostrongylus brasiliensis TaxID=27835 RepID=A0A0N4Y935_NIPBR|nr:unnamed protein product [Nippostrongylus brasiliensis]
MSGILPFSVQPSIAICEYVFLFMVFASYALDIAENRSVSLLLTCTAVEVEEYSAVSENGRKMFVGFSSPL